MAVHPAAIPEDRLFITAPGLAAILGCDSRTVLRMLERGEIEGAFKTGAVWRIPVAWIRERARLTPQPDPVTAEHLRIRRLLRGDGDAETA